MNAPLQLTWPRAGQLIDMRNIADRLEPLMVMNRCSSDDRRLFCAPCNQPLANVGQAERHVENGGTHAIVSICGRHGTPEPVVAAVVERVNAYAAQLPFTAAVES